MDVNTDKKKIEEVLSRGVDTIYPTKEKLQAELESGKRLRLYLGIDPTGADLHLGHTVPLRKLRQLQDLGHEVILLVGDFTGMIGDPTGKDKTREPLTREQVLENAKTYKEQAGKILDFNGDNPVQVKFNSEWLSKLTMEEVVNLSSNFTVQQMLQRDMFKRRIKEEKDIGFHEFLYPLMQGYDSVVMDVDLEIGATDQMFNMMAGRTLQRKLKDREKFVLTVPLLTDSEGRKIGKTTGNYIALNSGPNDLFGQVMALGDDVIFNCFVMCTDVSLEEIEAMKKAKNNPRDDKARLAKELVRMYYDEATADKAEQEFEKIFKNKEKPTDIPEKKIEATTDLIDLLTQLEMVSSKSDARRMVQQGAVKINDVKIEDFEKEIEVKDGDVIQVGKRKFAKIVL